MQEKWNLMACIKHFLNNEMETDTTQVLQPAYSDGHVRKSFKNKFNFEFFSFFGLNGIDRILNDFIGSYYSRWLQLGWLWDSFWFGGLAPYSWEKNFYEYHPYSSYSANVPQQAMMELYSKPFRAALAVGARAVMCSYNRVNNTNPCENKNLFQNTIRAQELVENNDIGSEDGKDIETPSKFVDMLVDQSNFPNIKPNFFVISDWGLAVDNGTRSYENGLDIEMPWSFRTLDAQQELLKLLKQEEAETYNLEKSETAKKARRLVDSKIRRILYSLKKANKLNNPEGYKTLTNQVWRNTTNPLRKSIARKIAGEGIVLLKNEKISKRSTVLPLFHSPNVLSDAFEILNLQLFGCSNGEKMAATGGSGGVTASYMTSVEDGILHYARELGSRVKTLIDFQTFDLSTIIEDPNSSSMMKPLSSYISRYKKQEPSSSENDQGGSYVDAETYVQHALYKLSDYQVLSKRYVAIVCLNPKDTPDERDYGKHLPLEYFDFGRIGRTPEGEKRTVVVYANSPGVVDVEKEITQANAFLLGFFPGEQVLFLGADFLKTNSVLIFHF